MSDTLLRPYSNYERDSAEQKKKEKQTMRNLEEITREYTEIRNNIRQAVIQYVRLNMMDEKYTDPLFDSSVAAIQMLNPVMDVDKVIEERLLRIFPNVHYDISNLSQEEKQYVSDNDDLSLVQQFSNNKQIPLRNALSFIAITRSRLGNIFSDSELSTLEEVLKNDSDFSDLIKKNNLMTGDKDEMKNIILNKYNTIYEQIKGVPTPQVIQRFVDLKKKYEDQIQELQFSDVHKALSIAESDYFELLKKYSIQRAQATLTKQNFSKKGKGRPKKFDSQVAIELKQLIDNLPNTFYRDKLISKFKKHTI